MPSEARVALITGCGKPVGIGNSTARTLAAAGIAVVVSDVSPAGVANEHNVQGDTDPNWRGVDSLVADIARAGGTASATLGDVSVFRLPPRRSSKAPGVRPSKDQRPE